MKNNYIRTDKSLKHKQEKIMAKQKTTREKILTHKLLPIILMTLNISFFFYILPISIAESYSTLFAILGGVVTLILSFWIFEILTPKLLEKIPILVGVIGISTFFIFGYFFITKTSAFAANELKENAVYTKAMISDKTKIYGKRGRSTQSISVRFLTKDNTKSIAKILVTKRYYEFLHEGMEIPIIYSSSHSNIAEIDYKKLRLLVDEK